LVESLNRSGFSGPFSGDSHEFMVKRTQRLIIPNPRRGDVDRGLLSQILRQAGISREEREAL
jgi:predicted RNA binding protein YcfA (HicA-like mRNA interferase family)